MYEHMCAGALEGRKRALAPLELELQEFVNLLPYVLGIILLLWKSSNHSYMLNCLSSPYFNHLTLFYWCSHQLNILKITIF